MEIINGLDFKIENSAVSLGKFDGFHRGHRLLLNRILEQKDMHATIFTFDGIWKGPQIYVEQEKRDLLQRLGVEREVLFPFREETKSMTPEAFIQEILVERMDAKLICVGEDFRFGCGRRGNVEMLDEYASKYGYELCVFPKICEDGEVISSTRIRRELAEGKIETANRLLGDPYFVSGEVVHGNALGRTIGMPTANLVPGSQKLLPVYGVYASRVEVDGKIYAGVTNVGVKPTVGASQANVETTLLHFDGDLYGKQMKVSDIIRELNRLGAKHGIGIIDIVENRVVGMKSRGVYETPGGTILYEAHQQLEELILDRDTTALKLDMGNKFAQIVYEGKWFTPLREAVQAFVDKTQEYVTGEVKFKLYKGNIIKAGTTSPYSLYNESIASFTTGDLYDHHDAEGFINLFGLSLKVRAMKLQENEKKLGN
mgnify:CR=1 FL=1